MRRRRSREGERIGCGWNSATTDGNRCLGQAEVDGVRNLLPTGQELNGGRGVGERSEKHFGLGRVYDACGWKGAM